MKRASQFPFSRRSALGDQGRLGDGRELLRVVPAIGHADREDVDTGFRVADEGRSRDVNRISRYHIDRAGLREEMRVGDIARELLETARLGGTGAGENEKGRNAGQPGFLGHHGEILTSRRSIASVIVITACMQHAVRNPAKS